MIPDIAVIIAAYAVARLLNEYVLVGPKLAQLRWVVGFVAVAVVVVFLADVLTQSLSLSDL